MENAANALRIAAGLLFGILLISLLVYMMDQFRSYAENESIRQTEEEKRTFNKKFEAYDKKQMYGTDVLSVINLAFNESASRDANGYGTSKDETLTLSQNRKGGEPVRITVKLNSQLRSNATFYGYTDISGVSTAPPVTTSPGVTPGGTTTPKVDRKEVKITPGNIDKFEELKSNNTLEELLNFMESKNQISERQKDSILSLAKTFDIDKKIFSELISSDGVVYTVGKGIGKDIKISINDYSSYHSKQFKKIVALQGRPRITIVNPNTTIEIDRTSGKVKDTWTRIIINTPSFDLKKRVFKADKIEYDENTGYIKSMTFQEI